MLIDPPPYARPPEIVQFRSGFTKQSGGDWVVWTDLQALERRMRTGSIGGYGDAVFDLAEDRSYALRKRSTQRWLPRAWLPRSEFRRCSEGTFLPKRIGAHPEV